MIYADMSKVIEKAVRDRGYVARGSFPGRGGKIWSNGRSRAVTVPPFVVPPRVGGDALTADQAVQKAFEDSLEDLVRNIGDLVAEGARSGAIAFQGGGDLQIPTEILEKFAALRFRVTIIHPGQFWEEGLFALEEILMGGPGLSWYRDDGRRERR